MTYAELNPQYNDLLLAIPPPPNFKLPLELQARYADLQKQPGVLEKALRDFIKTAETSYYAEVRFTHTNGDGDRALITKIFDLMYSGSGFQLNMMHSSMLGGW